MTCNLPILSCICMGALSPIGLSWDHPMHKVVIVSFIYLTESTLVVAWMCGSCSFVTLICMLVGGGALLKRISNFGAALILAINAVIKDAEMKPASKKRVDDYEMEGEGQHTEATPYILTLC